MENNAVFSVFVTNLGKYNEGYLVGRWVEFPTTQEHMQQVFTEIGLDGMRYEEYFITDYDSAIFGLTDCFGEFENLSMLNYLASMIQDMDYSIEQLEAMLELGEYTGSVEELINLIDNEECFNYMPDIEDDYDLGYAWVEEMGIYGEELKRIGTLANYIDYEKFGRDIRLV